MLVEDIEMNLQFGVLFTITSYFTIIHGRGPHHPRGESMVKRHTHYKPGKNAEKITQDAELLHDREHLQEHLENIIPKPDLSKMTDEELELYYFLLHDSDKNSKLDGLELLNAILHTTHEDAGHSQHNHENDIAQDDVNEDDNDHLKNGYGDSEEKESSFNQYVELVDQVLKEDDRNQDGYLDYAEYVEGRKRSEGVVKKSPDVRMVV